MTPRKLGSPYNAVSVALVGSGQTPGSPGAVLALNLFNSAFDGPIMPVNPCCDAAEDVATHPDADSLPFDPSLAVIATLPATVPGLIAAFAERSTKAAVIITAGFGTRDGAGPAQWQPTLDAARPHTMRIVGPNCLRIMVPGIGLNASFAQRASRKGPLAIVQPASVSPIPRKGRTWVSRRLLSARGNIKSLSATARKHVRSALNHNRTPPPRRTERSVLEGS